MFLSKTKSIVAFLAAAALTSASAQQSDQSRYQYQTNPNRDQNPNRYQSQDQNRYQSQDQNRYQSQDQNRYQSDRWDNQSDPYQTRQNQAGQYQTDRFQSDQYQSPSRSTQYGTQYQRNRSSSSSQMQSNIVGKKVRTQQGEQIGEVKGIVADWNQGRIQSVIVSGDDMGGKQVALSPSELRMSSNGDAFIATASKQEIRNKPAFRDSGRAGQSYGYQDWDDDNQTRRTTSSRDYQTGRYDSSNQWQDSQDRDWDRSRRANDESYGYQTYQDRMRQNQANRNQQDWNRRSDRSDFSDSQYRTGQTGRQGSYQQQDSDWAERFAREARQYERNPQTGDYDTSLNRSSRQTQDQRTQSWNQNRQGQGQQYRTDDYRSDDRDYEFQIERDRDSQNRQSNRYQYETDQYRQGQQSRSGSQFNDRNRSDSEWESQGNVEFDEDQTRTFAGRSQRAQTGTAQSDRDDDDWTSDFTKPSNLNTFRGEITSVDAEEKTITVKNEQGSSRTFNLAERPSLVLPGNRNPMLSDFKVGYDVRIGWKSEDGESAAHLITRTGSTELIK